MNDQNEVLIKQYKQQYFGKTYQWTRQINNETIGEVVRVTDVKQRGDMFMLVFNSGTPLNVNLVGQYLQPCDDSQVPFVPAININELESNIPPELREFTTKPSDKITFSNNQPEPAKQIAPPVKQKSEIFALFQSQEKNINMALKLKMPDIALVKMMYSNAADKDKFLTELSDYIIESVNADTIKEAIILLLQDGELIEKLDNNVHDMVTTQMEIEKVVLLPHQENAQQIEIQEPTIIKSIEITSSIEQPKINPNTNEH